MSYVGGMRTMIFTAAEWLRHCRMQLARVRAEYPRDSEVVAGWVAIVAEAERKAKEKDDE